jgi:hypothetical protein
VYDAVREFARKKRVGARKADFGVLRLRRLSDDGSFPPATVIGTGGDAGRTAG